MHWISSRIGWSQADFSIFGDAEEGWRHAVERLYACPNTVRIFSQEPKVQILEEVKGFWATRHSQ